MTNIIACKFFVLLQMIMLSRRIQYFAYFFFFVGICFYSYSYFSNLWYQVDFTEELKDSFVETKYYTEGLISACWFGDCVSLGMFLKMFYQICFGLSTLIFFIMLSYLLHCFLIITKLHCVVLFNAGMLLQCIKKTSSIEMKLKIDAFQLSSATVFCFAVHLITPKNMPKRSNVLL